MQTKTDLLTTYDQITELQQAVETLAAENQLLRSHKSTLGASVNRLMDDRARLSEELRRARVMAGLWKRIAKEHYHITRMVADYAKNLTLDEETE